jgi:O-antigen/teichoic acid export membrane protein
MLRRIGIRVPPALLRSTSALAVLFTGALSFSVLAFLTQMLLTRQLPVGDVGLVAALLTVINFLTPLATAGVNYFVLQSFGREGQTAMRWLSSCTRLAATATLFSSIALVFYVLQRGSDGRAGTVWILCTSVPMLLGQVLAELSSGSFQIEGRYTCLSAWQGITQTGRFGVVVVTAASAASLNGILVGYAIEGVLTAVASILLLNDFRQRNMRQWQDRAGPIGDHVTTACPTLQQTARQSLPFALMTMFYVLYFQGPIVTLEWLDGGIAAGIYNSAFLIICAMSIVPTIIYMKFLLPKICQWAEHDRIVFRAAFHAGVPMMMLAGLGLMVLVMSLGSWLLPVLFGRSYAAGVPALMILAVSIPVRFIQSVYSSLFIAADDMVRKVWYLAISGIVGATLSLCLVPQFGINGAAAATLLAEICLLVLHIDGAARFIDGINVMETLRFSTFRTSVLHLMQEQHSKA